jgi:hypothetical protein
MWFIIGIIVGIVLCCVFQDPPVVPADSSVARYLSREAHLKEFLKGVTERAKDWNVSGASTMAEYLLHSLKGTSMTSIPEDEGEWAELLETFRYLPTEKDF